MVLRDNLYSTNIVITFSENITKGSNASYITLKAGSASGTTRQSIDVQLVLYQYLELK